MGSEVARIKAEIELHYTAARYALHSPSLGTSQHKVISAKMSHVGDLHDHLKLMIGEGKAARFLVKTMNQPK